MENTFYIVIYKGSDEAWKPQTNGVFTDKRLAANFSECLNAQFATITHAVVEGSIIPLADHAKAEGELGPF